MDGRPNRRNKAAFSNFYGVARTAPKTRLSIEYHTWFSVVVRKYIFERIRQLKD